MAALKVLLLLCVLFASGQALREALCSGGLDTCYFAYQAAEKLTSDGSCSPYKTLKACVSALTGPGTCTDSEVAAHNNVRNAYAANLLCNGSSLPEVSILCLLIAGVVAFLFHA